MYVVTNKCEKSEGKKESNSIRNILPATVKLRHSNMPYTQPNTKPCVSKQNLILFTYTTGLARNAMTLNGVANFLPHCHKTQTHTHTCTHAHTHTRLCESHPKLHDSVKRSHSSLIYRRQNNNTPESLPLCICVCARLFRACAKYFC